MRTLLGAGVLGALLNTGPALAVEYTHFVPLPYVLASPPERDGPCNRMALMNLPPGWRDGDAAVLLLTAAALRDPLRDGLVSSLLQAGAAVVEAVTGAEAHCAGGSAEEAAAEAAPAEPLAVLFALLDAARRAGAGLTVAIGYGPGGAVALDAVRQEVAAMHGAPGTARLAAAAALGIGAPAFALGAPMPPAEAAPLRLRLLCRALEDLFGGLGEPARAGAARDAEACRAALAPDPQAPLRRTADLDR
jgi:hypothetical protein